MHPGSCRLCHALDLEPAEELTAGIVRMPDAFPAAPGHELILTTRHVGSVALAARYGLDLTQLQRELFADAARSCLLVEHGVPITHPRPGCVDHAHIHAFPTVDVSVDSLVHMASFRFARGAGLMPVDLQGLGAVAGDIEYVWVRDSTGNSVLVKVSGAMTVPSQLARRVVAEVLGIGGWDWRRSLALREARAKTYTF